MPLKGGHTAPTPNRALQQPGIGAKRDGLKSPLAKQPVIQNPAYAINPLPPGAARVPHKPPARPIDLIPSQFRPLNGGGVRYEAVKPVKDAVCAYEKRN
jgi:hypothetical protein